jgi:hypothetical protein
MAFNDSLSIWPIQMRVLGGGSRLPTLLSKGAVDHVSNLAVIQYTKAFTPRHLLGRPAPTGSMETLTVVTMEDNATRVGKCLLAGLKPPCLDATGGCVTGADTPQHRIENKCRQKALLVTQSSTTQWTMYQGELTSQPRWPLWQPIRAKCVHLSWLSIIQLQTSSRNDPPMVAPLALESLGQKQRCRRQWTGDLIAQPCPKKPLLISRLRLRRR